MSEVSHELWMKSVIGQELSEAEARELFIACSRETFKKDDKLFDEGEEAKALFLIVRGEIDIEKKTQSGTISTIATLVPGAVVGEMSLLTREKRSASARVITDDALLLRIEWSTFEKLLQENRSAAYKIIFALARLLAHRLKRINLKVAELSAVVPDRPGQKMEEFAKFKAKLFQDWSF